MGRAPCCSKVGLHRGPWTAREDRLLINYIQSNGEGRWRSLPKKAGLLRCGKSCRLRWMNYLRPDIKRGNITPDEDDLIIRLHSLLGNRWSLIAGRLPGRTDNEIKNYWNSHLSKRLKNTSTTKDKCLLLSSDQPMNKIKKGNNNYPETATPNGETYKKMNKIYIPKAVRVSSAVSSTRTKSFNSNMGSGSSGNLAGLTDNLHWSWSDLEGEALHGTNNYYKDDYVYGYVSSSQTYMPMTNDDKMLDGIFEEYERLLKTENIAHLDSFIDSLLA